MKRMKPTKQNNLTKQNNFTTFPKPMKRIKRMKLITKIILLLFQNR
jgi:hypothetical protein